MNPSRSHMYCRFVQNDGTAKTEHTTRMIKNDHAIAECVSSQWRVGHTQLLHTRPDCPIVAALCQILRHMIRMPLPGFTPLCKDMACNAPSKYRLDQGSTCRTYPSHHSDTVLCMPQ